MSLLIIGKEGCPLACHCPKPVLPIRAELRVPFISPADLRHVLFET